MALDDIPTATQLAFAKSLAVRLGEEPSAATANSRRRLAAWIGSKRREQKNEEKTEVAASGGNAQSARTRAMERAVEALLDCDPIDREKLMVAGLQKQWGDGPLDSFLETELLEDASWWALSATPMVLSIYLKVIEKALREARPNYTTWHLLRDLAVEQE